MFQGSLRNIYARGRHTLSKLTTHSFYQWGRLRSARASEETWQPLSQSEAELALGDGALLKTGHYKMTQHLLQGQLTRQTIKIKLSFLSLLQIFHKDTPFYTTSGKQWLHQAVLYSSKAGCYFSCRSLAGKTAIRPRSLQASLKEKCSSNSEGDPAGKEGQEGSLL